MQQQLSCSHLISSSFIGSGSFVGSGSSFGIVLSSSSFFGSGKRTSMNAADLGVPPTLVSEAVFPRCVFCLVDERRCVKHVGECCCAAA